MTMFVTMFVAMFVTMSVIVSVTIFVTVSISSDAGEGNPVGVKDRLNSSGVILPMMAWFLFVSNGVEEEEAALASRDSAVIVGLETR
jgi:hypothetical protein